MVGAPRDQRVEHAPDGSRDRPLVLRERGAERAQPGLRARAAAGPPGRARQPRTTGPTSSGSATRCSTWSGPGRRRGRRASARAGSERELEEAMVVLAATPRSLDRAGLPGLRVRADDGARRQGGDHPDRARSIGRGGQAWRAELRQRERREFAIIDGLDPRDRDYEARQRREPRPDEFERWQREPPRLQLSAIAAALREAPPAPPPRA